MEKILAKRAMALFVIMALAMVAFVGLFAVGEEELPDPFEVTVTDDYGTATDMMGYVGTVFNFTFSDDLGIVDNDTWYGNLSFELTIDGTPMDLKMYLVNDGSMNLWAYEWTAMAAGTFDWEVNISDVNFENNFVLDSGMLTVYDYPMWDGMDTTTFEEDGMLSLDLDMEFTGEGLTFAEEAAPMYLTIAKDGNVWNFSAEENWYGYEHVNITATDMMGEMVYHVYNITVTMVNDAPMIEYIMIDDMEYAPEIYNYTWVEDDVNMSEFRSVINLSLEEDGMLSFMVYAMDIEMDNLTYTFDVEDVPVTYMNDLSETNATIWSNFTFTGDMDENGYFWGMLTVSDGEFEDMVYITFNITAMNDAPTADMPDWDMMQFDIKTGEMINKTVSGLADIDGDDVTVMWYIDGTMVADWEEIYFAYSWDASGVYNVSAKISDGDAMVDVGYFWANVTIANTAPVITDVSATPVDIDPFDILDFYILGEVEEGKDVELTVDVTDAEGDDLTYSWTNNQDSAWSADTATVVIPGDYLQKGLTYTFTVVVSDGTESVTMASNNITIVEKDDTEGFLESLGILCIILIVAPILLLIIIIVVVMMKKKGKKEEPAPEEPPMEEEMPMEGGEEMPMEGEAPMEEGMEEPMMEQPVAEEPVPAPEEPVPAQEEPVPAPEEPVPAPEEPVPAPEEPVPAPEEPVAPAPEEPPAPPEPPMPPQ